MKEKPLVSIAMATYNGGQFLRKQLDSIYGQTYPEIEVIVTDDGSIDETVDILEEYRESHGLMYSVNKKNLGFVKNFEQALSRCRGEYIALADQDDIWKPEKIERLVNAIGEYSLVCSDAELIDRDDQIIGESHQAFSRTYWDVDNQFSFFVFRNYVTGCTALFRKEILQKALPIPNGIMYHDWWLSLVAASMEGVIYLDEQLVQYRQHGAQDTGAGERMTLLKKIHEYRQKKREGFKKEMNHVRGLLQFSGFNREERSIIEDRFLFYENILSSRPHWESLKIALKYRESLLAGRSIWYRLAFYLASLLK